MGVVKSFRFDWANKSDDLTFLYRVRHEDVSNRRRIPEGTSSFDPERELSFTDIEFCGFLGL